MKYKILISLVIVIIIFLYFGSVIKGNNLLPELLLNQDIHLEEMERINVPKESFTSIETLPRQKVINGLYDTIQTKMNLAAQAQSAAKTLAIEEQKAINDDNNAIIGKIDNVLTGNGNRETLPDALKAIQMDNNPHKVKILASLEKNRWNKTLTAKDLNISRATLWRKIKAYSLQNN